MTLDGIMSNLPRACIEPLKSLTHVDYTMAVYGQINLSHGWACSVFLALNRGFSKGSVVQMRPQRGFGRLVVFFCR